MLAAEGHAFGSELPLASYDACSGVRPVIRAHPSTSNIGNHCKGRCKRRAIITVFFRFRMASYVCALIGYVRSIKTYV